MNHRYIHNRTDDNRTLFLSLQLKRNETRGELTHRGGDGAPSLWAIQTGSSNLFLRGPGLDAPGGAVLPLQSLLLAVIIFHMVMQQLGLTE